eukprot:PITA_32193
MHNDESVANYFLRVDEIVNCMKNLGEEIKEVVVVEKVLRSLSPRFESKVFAIEEKENLRNLTMPQLHRILTAYEMRKGGPLDRREAAFKASDKGDYYEKEIEKTKALNLKFVKGSETLDEIINVQCSPLIKTGLGYNGEASQASTSKRYLDVARRSEKRPNRNHQVNQGKFTSTMNKDYQENQAQSTLRINRSHNQP